MTSADHMARHGDAAPAGMRIALLGPYASANLGDTASQMAVCAGLRAVDARLVLVGISPDPADTLESLDLPAFPLDGQGPASGWLARQHPPTAAARSGLPGWISALPRLRRFMRGLNLLVISGGGQLDDYWGGPWGHPWSLLVWCALARSQRVPVVFLCVGLDRLETRLSRLFARQALRLASVRIFRDAASRAAMQAAGVSGGSRILPDLAFGLADAPGAAANLGRPFAVINPIARNTWSHTEDAGHARYLAGLVAAGEALARRGLALRIACSQPRMDLADARWLAEALRGRGVADVRVAEVATVADYFAAVRGAQLVIASRLHGVILALVAGCPVVALSPLKKVEQVMADAGLAGECLPLREFEPTALQAVVIRVLADVDGYRDRVRERARAWRAALDPVYPELRRLAHLQSQAHDLHTTRGVTP